jgi:hypothetical protein
VRQHDDLVNADLEHAEAVSSRGHTGDPPAAYEDPHFRHSLSGVCGWERIPPDVLARIDALFGDEPRL